MARSLLSEALSHGHAFASAIITLDAMAKEGRQPEALTALGNLSKIAEANLPIISAVITAQRQAAEIANLPERPRLVAGAFANVPQPHPHATNDQHQAPSEPDDIIA
ncbi:hypothetical protein [Phenylobacterium sp.]|uniref:hypothetical protein n=1 Tax=Phenylobacterium sp. TaxID=1871053 RepID=UPI0030039EFF